MDNMKLLLLLALTISVSSRSAIDFEGEVVLAEATFQISASSSRVEDVDEIVVLQEEWNLFKTKHSKVYVDSTEESLRKKIFLENKRQVIEHNRLYALGQVSFEMGLNQFADLKRDEFVAATCGSMYNSSAFNFFELQSPAATFIGPDFAVPVSIDWRQYGAVTPVKNQGQQCGSCWAFAATGCLEGQHFRKTRQLVSLSEQNLIDCSTRYGNSGCNGGFAVRAFQYIRDNGGIDTEWSYPYQALLGQCRYNSRNSEATVRGIANVRQGDENELKRAVATIGPIAVSMDSTLDSFKFYNGGGVYFDPNCMPNRLTHAVLVVGYGTTRNGEDFWIVKNSWGTWWGQQGYFFMARNRNNHCGIASMGSYPLV